MVKTRENTKEKSVRAIGKITAIITAVTTEAGSDYKAELGELIDERKQQMARAIEDGKNFMETDFKKTPRAPMGSRVFDLTQILEKEHMPETHEIAELLKDNTWG